MSTIVIRNTDSDFLADTSYRVVGSVLPTLELALKCQVVRKAATFPLPDFHFILHPDDGSLPKRRK